jgi:hypothetical protein
VLLTVERENRNLGKEFTMNEFKLHLQYSTENPQGYDPHEWVTEEEFLYYEEALVAADYAVSECEDDPLTTVTYVITQGDKVVPSTRPVCGERLTNAYMLMAWERQRRRALRQQCGDDVIIDDDDLPF